MLSSLAYPCFEVHIEQNGINKKLNKLNDFCLLLYPMPVLWSNCHEGALIRQGPFLERCVYYKHNIAMGAFIRLEASI